MLAADPRIECMIGPFDFSIFHFNLHYGKHRFAQHHFTSLILALWNIATRSFRGFLWHLSRYFA